MQNPQLLTPLGSLVPVSSCCPAVLLLGHLATLPIDQSSAHIYTLSKVRGRRLWEERASQRGPPDHCRASRLSCCALSTRDQPPGPAWGLHHLILLWGEPEVPRAILLLQMWKPRLGDYALEVVESGLGLAAPRVTWGHLGKQSPMIQVAPHVHLVVK